jgi:hypothetical protein
MYEDVILKMYAFAKSVFGTPDVTLPPPADLGIIARFPFTTGENQSLPIDVVKGIRVSNIKTGQNITANFTGNALETRSWDGFNISAHRYIGFEIKSNPACSFILNKIDLKMKKSTVAQVVNGIFNYGLTFPPVTTKGVQSNGIATTDYSVVSLLPSATIPAQTNGNLCFGIGIATKGSTSEVIFFDEITVYGEVTKPVYTVPTLLADMDTISFETNMGSPVSVPVTFFGELLENTVQVSVENDVNGCFSVDKDYATVSELEYGKTLNVTFNAADGGNYTALLKLKSDEVTMSVPITAVSLNISAVDKVTSGKVWVSDQTLHANGFNQAELKIYNLSGQLILQQNHLPAVFATSSLNQGIYFVKIRGEESFIRKINIM